MPSQLKFKKFKTLLKKITEEMEENNTKAMGKVTTIFLLMLIVSLFLTSCSGIVTPELQLDLDEDINKVETVTASVPGGNGTALPATQDVNYGASAIISIDPDEGYSLASITDNGVPVDITGITDSYVIDPVTENHAVVFAFSINILEIDYVYLDVPYEKYAGPNWCLPASGAMIFEYFGENITQNEIASKVIKNGSSSVFRFITFAKNLEFDTEYKCKTIEEIKDLLKQDIPVIAIQHYSLTIPYSHARVIIGYDDEKQEVITNDPTAGKDYKISYSDFLALNFNSNPDKCKVIVISTEEVDTINAELIDNTDNS